MPGHDATRGRGADSPRVTADEGITALYVAHQRSLVRLATLLLRDAMVAEEVVQDAFVAVHDRWRRLREPDDAVAYLRQSVVNRCRSVQRRRVVALKHLPQAAPDAPAADADVVAHERRGEVLAALRELPTRQREVLVLRYYLDLSEADIATTLGISRGAVKSHASRGSARLREILTAEPPT